MYSKFVILHSKLNIACSNAEMVREWSTVISSSGSHGYCNTVATITYLVAVDCISVVNANPAKMADALEQTTCYDTSEHTQSHTETISVTRYHALGISSVDNIP